MRIALARRVHVHALSRQKGGAGAGGRGDMGVGGGVSGVGIGYRGISPFLQCDRRPIVADSSMDIVSKVDRQEVDNALNQAVKEVAQRYDFKNIGASIAWSGEKILMTANSEERVLAILDVLETKMIRRGVSLKHLDIPENGPQPSGKEYRLEVSLKEGLAGENAKKVTKIIREEGPKGVKTQITGEEVRATSKSRDDLQEVQTLLKGADLDFAVQFTNYR